MVAVREESAGVEIVTSTAIDRTLPWRFDPILHLGGRETGPEAFFRIPPHGLATDEAGFVYVLDTGNRNVHVFDRSAAHVRTFGRRGRGPGELQYPSSLMVDESGAVTIHDIGSRLLLRYDAEGRFVEQLPAPRAVFGPLRRSGAALVYAARGSDSEGSASILTVRSIIEEDTAVLAQIRTPASQELYYESCGVSISLPPLFADPPPWDSRAGKTAVAYPPDYSVQVSSIGGRERIIRRRMTAERASEQDAVRQLGTGEEWVIGDRPCTVPPTEVVRTRGVAEYIPVISRVAVSPDGWLWVQRRIVGAQFGPIDVFDATGAYTGTLAAETPWPAAFGQDGEILVLELSEADVPHVVVYRITGN